uniref:hypothetical protein n=1 Tax=Altererythrobacter segetis TaxID=1104773 RepID=UPI00140915B2|nr:hypothetical protein [Altererythrobacter segetis]
MLIERGDLEKIVETLAALQTASACAFAILNDKLDDIDGDADLEEGGDDEPVSAEGDSNDVAYVEWATKPGNLRRRGGPELLAGLEDDEDDDADTCAAADDQGGAGGRWCDTDGLPGDSADAEDGHDREQDADGY